MRILSLKAKRDQIAAQVVLELGPLASLSQEERMAVDRQTEETIEGCASDASEPSDCSDADRTIRCLLSEHRTLEEMTPEEVNVRLAEEGEVFAPEDNA